MIYRFLQFLMRISIGLHYEGIIVENNKKLPDAPIIIASNHPNSFLDAIIIGSILNRSIFFLARSDVFKAKWADYILRKMNLIPIYRIEEGHNNLNKNDETFSSCYEILEKDKCILIFAEGVSLVDRKIYPIKKGIARIGLGAESRNNFELGVSILPVGINYEQATKFNNRIIVSLGDLMPFIDYKESLSLIHI